MMTPCWGGGAPQQQPASDGARPHTTMMCGVRAARVPRPHQPGGMHTWPALPALWLPRHSRPGAPHGRPCAWAPTACSPCHTSHTPPTHAPAVLVRQLGYVVAQKRAAPAAAAVHDQHAPVAGLLKRLQRCVCARMCECVCVFFGGEGVQCTRAGPGLRSGCAVGTCWRARCLRACARTCAHLAHEGVVLEAAHGGCLPAEPRLAAQVPVCARVCVCVCVGAWGRGGGGGGGAHNLAPHTRRSAH
jgi:hypothetical protein